MGTTHEGNDKIKLAERNMAALVKLGERYRREQPFKVRSLADKALAGKAYLVQLHARAPLDIKLQKDGMF